jgi:nitrous oxide reductase
MCRRSLILTTVAALALAISLNAGLSGAGSAAASTGAAHRVHVAASEVSTCQVVAPPVSGDYLQLYNGSGYSGDEWLCGCTSGTTYYNVLTPVKSFINNCDYKAWLQYSNDSSYCISPLEFKADVGSAYWYPKSEYVGYETDDC